jgi:hypothetical protein
VALRFDGWIGGSAFASGDLVVVGRWARSPFGPFADVMWARSDGARILLAEREDVTAFVRSHYAFDEHVETPVTLALDGERLTVRARDLELTLERLPRRALGWALRARPRALRTSRRWIGFEDRWLRPLLGPALGASADVRTTGVTLAGVREWYAIHDAWPARATFRVRDRDAGPPDARAGRGAFGFSEFLAEPAIVRVTSMFER